MNSSTMICWACGGSDLAHVKAGVDPSALTSDNFRITDSSYGATLDLYRCQDCKFIQATNSGDLVQFYEAMSDSSYRDTLPTRMLQFKDVLNKSHCFLRRGKLLDVGTGAGDFLVAAQMKGYVAEGIEPCKELAQLAVSRGLQVTNGVLGDSNVGRNTYDTVALIDVIEHVAEPLALLNQCKKNLVKGGTVLVLTPNVDSFFARLLGFKWWHYRIAHVGYFNQVNLDLLFERAEFKRIGAFYPKWYFPLRYLLERLSGYGIGIPISLLPQRLLDLQVPVQLFDSIGCIYESK